MQGERGKLSARGCGQWWLPLFSRRLAWLSAILVAFATGLVAQWLPAHVAARAAAGSDRWSLAWEAYGYVRRYYALPLPSDAELVYGAVEGALETLGDPYTRFLPPAESQVERDRLAGQFGGIEALVEERGGLIYLRPIPGGAAERAGIQDGDQLLSIDGAEVKTGTALAEVVARIRGPVGKAVCLGLRRPNSLSTREVCITRVAVQLPTVEWQWIEGEPGKVALLRVRMFGERTAAEVARALADIQAGGGRALILDLRDNPGGLLEAAVDVASLFVSRGVVAYEVRAGGREVPFPVTEGRLAWGGPVVTLVNGQTASAAEILAGALQDHRRSRLLGQRTRGKGSVQLAYQLSDGSSLRVTSALWLTPARRLLEGSGLQPDVVLPATMSSEALIQRAIDELPQEVAP